MGQTSDVLTWGEPVVADGAHPVLLDDSASVWLVEQGPINVFSVLAQGDQEIDVRHFLFCASQGDLLFGIDPPHEQAFCKLVAVGHLGGQLRRFSFADLLSHLKEPDPFIRWGAKLNGWVSAIKANTQGALDDQFVRGPDDLPAFNQLALNCLHEMNRNRVEEEDHRSAETLEREQSSFSDSLSKLLLLFQNRSEASVPVAVEDALVASCQMIFDNSGLVLTIPQSRAAQAEHEDAVQVLADASGVRVRQIALKGSWWTHDYGSLLAILKQNDQPVALMPTRRGHYQLYNPVEGSCVALTQSNASLLQDLAYCFLSPLPPRETSAFGFAKWALAGQARDVAQILVSGFGIGVLSVTLPASMAPLFDHIIPSASYEYLWQYVSLTCMAGLAVAILGVSQLIAISRVARNVAYRVQCAVMDHLIRLPPAFFRRFASGELAFRALGVDQIREVLSNNILQALLVGLFSFCNLAALFYFSAKLALVACALFGVQAIYVGLIYAHYLKVLQQKERAVGEASEQVYEILSGIAKIRVAGAEKRLFVRWSSRLKNQVIASQNANRISNLVSILDAIFILVFFSAIILVISRADDLHLSVGRFLAFASICLSFSLLFGILSQLFAGILQVVPYFRGLKPILDAEPEVRANKAEVGLLSGEIEVVRASFRYVETGRQVLIDVSFKVEPGQLVALVGPSGAGKSTFLRLLLGFDEPTSGAVYYDGQDLSSINAAQLRKQLGVVLQNGQLLPGSILENIIGSSLLTIDDAWAAAKMCGLDEDIQNMPMGMHTVIGEGNGISGGQRQRILIARALVRRPKILFFDEATSALDNYTQRIVTESIAKLNVARVVIAHRLSSIRDADKIYVLERGRIVQSGQYDELLAEPGVFADLARRQLA
jgi:NHLM bacteriocin system ABC transporter ATP-binding protein